jgi:hypothetical protein
LKLFRERLDVTREPVALHSVPLLDLHPFTVLADALF